MQGCVVIRQAGDTAELIALSQVIEHAQAIAATAEDYQGTSSCKQVLECVAFLLAMSMKYLWRFHEFSQ